MSKTPTAAARTISMFTGKTDLDDDRARDGSPSELRDRPRLRPIKWAYEKLDGCVRWFVDAPRANTEIIVRGGVYTARVGSRHADFKSMVEASNWAEGELRKKGW